MTLCLLRLRKLWAPLAGLSLLPCCTASDIGMALFGQPGSAGRGSAGAGTLFPSSAGGGGMGSAAGGQGGDSEATSGANGDAGTPLDPELGGGAGGAAPTAGRTGTSTTRRDGAHTTRALTGDVTFSVPSGTFQDALSVGLSGPTGAEIRYTTDGTLPSASSPLYDGTVLTLSATTQLRAQAFDAREASGLPSTAIYVARTFDAESEIPIVIMEGYGGGRPQKEASFGGGDAQEMPAKQPLQDLGFLLFEPVDGVARISASPTLVARAGYRERGQSAADAEKSPYKVELWDNQDQDVDLPLLDMPPESDWVMIGEAFDATQIQSSLVYSLGDDIGLSVPRLRFAELYINFDGGPLEPEDYFGLYAITETIKNQKDRVDLRQLDAAVTTLPEITGGYILKFDQAALDNGETRLVCAGSALLQRGEADDTAHCWNELGLVDPEILNAAQLAYLESYVQAFHDTLHTTPIGDYAEYIDVTSFVDQMIIQELTRNLDAYVRSQYFHKDRNGLLSAGPLWDYNLAMSSWNVAPEGWSFESQLTGRGNDDWFYKLGMDPAFMTLFAARWQELRRTILSDAAVLERIDELSAPIAAAAARNYERWGPNAPNDDEEDGKFGGGGGLGGGIDDWPTALVALEDWLPRRLAWIDANIPMD